MPDGLSTGAKGTADASKLLSCTSLDAPAGQKVGSRSAEDIVGVDRRAFPPAFGGRELEHGKMEMRCVPGGVARGADVANHLPTLHRVAFLQSRRVAFEVGIVV